jgi:hypothetical protein
MDPTEDFVLTADVEDYIELDLSTDTQEEVGAVIEPDLPADPVIETGLVEVTEIMPVEEPQEAAPAVAELGDGLYLDSNGQGLEAALAAYQEAVSEGVDFTLEGSGTWYYNVGAFSFIPS